MKILKFSALVLGAAAMITGFNSCSKDDDNGNECCTISYTDTYDGNTYSVNTEACEDGTYTIRYTYDGQTETETGDWRNDYGSWSELKQELLDEGATCD